MGCGTSLRTMGCGTSLRTMGERYTPRTMGERYTPRTMVGRMPVPWWVGVSGTMVGSVLPYYAGIPTTLYIHPPYHPGYTSILPYPVVYRTMVYSSVMCGRRCPGLKAGERPGWEEKGRLRLINVSSLVGDCAQSYSALPCQKHQRSDRRRYKPHVFPYGPAMLRIVLSRECHPSAHPISDINDTFSQECGNQAARDRGGRGVCAEVSPLTTRE